MKAQLVVKVESPMKVSQQLKVGTDTGWRGVMSRIQHWWLAPDAILSSCNQHIPFISSHLCQLMAYLWGDPLALQRLTEKLENIFSFPSQPPKPNHLSPPCKAIHFGAATCYGGGNQSIQFWVSLSFSLSFNVCVCTRMCTMFLLACLTSRLALKLLVRQWSQFHCSMDYKTRKLSCNLKLRKWVSKAISDMVWLLLSIIMFTQLSNCHAGERLLPH